MIVTSFALTFDPPTATTGAPTVRARSNVGLKQLDFFLQTDHDAPSSARLLTSFGVDLPPARRDGDMQVQPTVDFFTFFWSSGVFASALTSAVLRIFVEEFTGAFAFVRGIDGASFTLADDDTWWFSGSKTMSPAGQDLLVALPRLDQHIPVRRGNRYRVWLDLHGQVRGAGFGGLGGSGAISQALVHVDQLEILLDGRDW